MPVESHSRFDYISRNHYTFHRPLQESIIAKTPAIRKESTPAAQENQNYIVTARKWRPMVFDDIVGQEHITRTLRNALSTGRLSHAYIFGGPRGVGKTTTARILAKAINCLNPKNHDPDNSCEICTEITEGRSLNVFEIDGASNRSIDDIRNLRDAVRYGPTRGKYKVYIIDEVHMLTKEAFNALLKTLEEPPAYVVFIFATTEIHKVLPTILSRCQRFDFRRIATKAIVERLRFIASEEKITIDDDALLLIAKRGDGSLRDAQSIFDQIVSFCGDNIRHTEIRTMLNLVDEDLLFRVTEAIHAGDVKAGLLIVDEVVAKGYDLREFTNGLIEHFRNLLIITATGSTQLLEMPEVHLKRSQELAAKFGEADLLRLLKIANDTEAALRWSTQPRYKLEFGILQMIKMDATVHIDQLLRELREMKGAQEDTALSSATRPFHQQYSTPTPVRGNVKATPPTLRPDQRVAAAQQGEIIPTGSMQFPDLSTVRAVSSPPKPVPAEPPFRISDEEIMGKWPMLVDEARKQKIAVGTMLSGTSVIGLNENRLCIGCPDDFTLDALKRNNQFLLDLAQKVYGAKLHFDAILSDPRTKADTKQPAGESSPENPLRQHPVVQALIRDLGAREIE